MKNNKIKVCFVDNKTGVTYHRLSIPFNNIAVESDDIFEITSTNGFTAEFNPSRFDIIVINRLLKQDTDWLLRCKEMGIKIILDLDDHFVLPTWHHSKYTNFYPEIEKRILLSMSYADVIWCVSERLKTEILKVYPNKEVIVVPNAIDFTQPQFIPLEKDKCKRHDKYTIGYIGASNHHQDLALLGQSFANLYHPRYKGKYALMLAGINNNSQNSNDYWNAMINIFTTNGHLPHEDFVAINATDQFNYAYSYNIGDLFLAPLYKDTFTECKSSLKILEAGAFSKPIICSNIAPYKEFIQQGLVYTATEDWSKHMKDLIDNPEKGIKLGKRLHQYVRDNYDINIINVIREESLQELFDKK